MNISGLDTLQSSFTARRQQTCLIVCCDGGSLFIVFFAYMSYAYALLSLVSRLFRDLAREQQEPVSKAPAIPPYMRQADSEFMLDTHHDISLSISILELAPSGVYLPVTSLVTSSYPEGTFQLKQGVQRRIRMRLTHSSGRGLPWVGLINVKVGKVRIMQGGRPDEGSSDAEITLTLLPPAAETPTFLAVRLFDACSLVFARYRWLCADSVCSSRQLFAFTGWKQRSRGRSDLGFIRP